MEKEENAGNQHFLLFLKMFSTLSKGNSAFLICLTLLTKHQSLGLLSPRCFQRPSFWGYMLVKLAFLCAAINPFPNDKILHTTKLKALADDNLNIAKMTISLFDREENTVGKGENAGHQHFLLFPQCFPKPPS